MSGWIRLLIVTSLLAGLACAAWAKEIEYQREDEEERDGRIP